MHKLVSRTGAVVSYRRSGEGPVVLRKLEEHFTVVAVARRGRGETDATEGHTLDEEAADVVSIIEAQGEPVFLLGHSYGGHVALRAAASVPARVRKLVVYEAPWPAALGKELEDELERLGEAGRWDEFSWTFFHRGLCVPAQELDRLRAEGLWEPIVGDAKASLGDLRALAGCRFEPDQYRGLQVSTLLQAGAESPRHLYVTDALAGVLPDVVVEDLMGQAHEGMTTAPEMYAESVIRFLS